MRKTLAFALALAASTACTPSRVPLHRSRAPQIDVDLEEKFGRIRPALDGLSSDGFEEVRIHFRTPANQRIESLVLDSETTRP